MTNTFLTSMSNAEQTANGGATNASSLSSCVDLFFQVGSMRGKEEEDILVAWTKAFLEDPQTALKILFWSRDVRQGAGERRVFRTVLSHLATRNSDLFTQNLIAQIPEFGRWDDLLVFFGTGVEVYAVNVIRDALRNDDALCAKWMPREKGSKSHIARALRNHLGMNPKSYRKMLSRLTSVVETQMCDRNWDEINYSHVPSQAMRIYKNAFKRQSPESWNEYVEKLTSGEAKVNAGAIHPHEILGDYISISSNGHGYPGRYSTKIQDIPQIVEEQWNALPNWMSANSGNILPVVDTSGSMMGLPIKVAVSLGIYISERVQGPFKNHFVTFSENPRMQKMKGESLHQKLTSICNSGWGMSTNIEGTFDAILHHAVSSGATAKDMPKTILILSDMEFDSCASINETAMQSIRRQYNESGFDLPNIVFWNLNARLGNVPVRFDEQGTALVSGFSPTIMKSLLSDAENFTPESIMRTTINAPRYERISFECK